MSAEGSKYHWASSSTYWLSGRGESFGTRQLEKTTRPSGWIGSAKLPFPHYRPHSADLSQVWADVVEVVGDAYYLATEGSWVVPLSRSNGKTILSVCWKIKRMSSLSLNSWEEQHVRRIDKRWETESQRALRFSPWLPVWQIHERIFSWLFHLPCLEHDEDIIVICCVFRNEIQIHVTWIFGGFVRCREKIFWLWRFISAHPETSNAPSPQELQFGLWIWRSVCLFFGGGYRNLFTTPGRLMHIKCHLWGHAVAAGHFVVFT